MSPWTFILSLFTGGGGIVSTVKDGIVQAQKQRLDAQNKTERLEADKELAYWEHRADTLNTAAKVDRWYSPRSLMAYSVTIFVFKIIVWDTVFALGVTQDPGTLVRWITITIIGFYFVSRSAETIVSALANSLARGRK